MHPKIKHFSRIFGGHQTRRGVDAQPDGSHFLLQIRDFNEARTAVHPEGLIRIDAAGMDSDACLRSGDVIFLAKGTRNFAYTIPDSLPSPLLAGGYFFVLRLKREAFAPYVSWYLNQEPARRYFFRTATTGAHIPVVRREDLENLEVPLPPWATQEKIVELATLAERQRALLAELAEKKKSLATVACLRAVKEPFSN